MVLCSPPRAEDGAQHAAVEDGAKAAETSEVVVGGASHQSRRLQTERHERSGQRRDIVNGISGRAEQDKQRISGKSYCGC